MGDCKFMHTAHDQEFRRTHGNEKLELRNTQTLLQDNQEAGGFQCMCSKKPYMRQPIPCEELSNGDL